MICELPGGILDASGRRHREAELIAPGGREEELLATVGARETASLVSELLSRCVPRIGELRDFDPGALLVGDRTFLLLKLREMTFGEQVAAVVHCPYPTCGATVDVDLSIRDVPVRPIDSENFRVEYSDRLEHGDEPPLDVVFRLPTGADQAAVGPLLANNEAVALTALLARCLVSAEDTNGAKAAEDLSPGMRVQLERRMEAVAPTVLLDFEAHCHECQRDFGLPFHLQDFFFGELRIHRDLLYREVHYLAFHYHWSESEIMDMPREKRRKYIEVLGEEIERYNETSA